MNNDTTGNNSTSLVDAIPTVWVASLRPFLQRADEFDSRVPVVAYFLRTHAAFLAMQLHKQQKTGGGSNVSGDNSSNSTACKQYLRLLLNTLEQQKQQLAQALSGVDGRTILTRYALMLFSQADDAERAGAAASVRLVQLFFTASILFDATAQFTPDGGVDAVAAEKRNYARYIAVRMKRALDSGTPYVSPNKTEQAQDVRYGCNASEEEGDQVEGNYGGNNYQHNTNSNCNESNNNNNNKGGVTGKEDPPYQAQQQFQQPFSPPAPAVPPQPPSYSTVCPSSPQTPPKTWTGKSHTVESSNSNRGDGPSMEAMLAAQKYCKQAVSALQFYDHASARQQILSALNTLDGKLK